MSNGDRSDTWNLLFVANVNVLYWKRLIGHFERRIRFAKLCTITIGFVVAIILAIAKNDLVTSGVSAVSAFLIAVIGGPLLMRWKSGVAKMAHQRWSLLCSEAEDVWRHGEERGWDSAEIMVRRASLVEREKQYQANEYHEPKRSLLKECEVRAFSQLPNAYRTQEGQQNG